MEKAYGYVRVSGKGQVDGDGFARQEYAIREYAYANWIKIIDIFRDEGVSGTLADRPALAEMMVSLEQNGLGIHTVIIERVDRLARDLMVQETIIDDLKKSGVSILSAADGDLLQDDPTRKLVRQVLGAISEYDKTMTVLKLRAARARKRKLTGKCEGRKGYADAHPDTISEIKRLRRKPIKGKRLSAAQIAERLNEMGRTTADGKPFTGNNVAVILHRHG